MSVPEDKPKDKPFLFWMRNSKGWLDGVKKSYGVDESHPRVARIFELHQKAETVGITYDEWKEFRKEHNLLDDELIPIWSAAHPDTVIIRAPRGPSARWVASVEAGVVDKNHPKRARILEIWYRQKAGISSPEEKEESLRLFDELNDEYWKKHMEGK